MPDHDAIYHAGDIRFASVGCAAMKSRYMTDGEITMFYRQARDKRREITILAELNGMRRAEVINILLDAGELKPRSAAYIARWSPWSPEEIERLIAESRRGKSWAEVAALFPGRPVEAVKSFAYTHGLRLGVKCEFVGRLKPRVWGDGKKEAAFELARQGLTYGEIAEHFGTNARSVRNMFNYERARGEEVPFTIDGRRRKE